MAPAAAPLYLASSYTFLQFTYTYV